MVVSPSPTVVQPEESNKEDYSHDTPKYKSSAESYLVRFEEDDPANPKVFFPVEYCRVD